MATICLKYYHRLFGNFGSSPVLLTNIRGAAKKTGSSSRNSKGGKHKIRGLKKVVGEHAYRGNVLFTQYGMKAMPGMNVSLSRKCHLTAAEHGTLLITREKLQLDPDNPIVQNWFAGQLDHPLYKLFIHIIPDPIPPKFKLIDQV